MKQARIAIGDSVNLGSNKNRNTYKITISILFGLFGFVINFHGFDYLFPPYSATILIGMLFPMLISLNWGWKYGLLSALAGGCQSIWWIWGPSNGYATFIVVPPFTLWVIWHGYFAYLRRKRKDYGWWLNKYIIEIPFRILSTINLYTLARWAITLNPPPWNWAADSANVIPMHFSSFVVVKQAVVAYIILLLADVLLNFGFVKRFFRLKERTPSAKTGHIISVSSLFGVLFWIVDSIFCYLIFHSESSFLDLLALNIPPYVLYVRTAFILACLAGGVVASGFLLKQRESEVLLRESEEKLSQIIKGSSVPTFVINNSHVVTHWNKACESLTGITASEVIGTDKQWTAFYSKKRPIMADIIVDKATGKVVNGYYHEKYQESVLINGAYQAEDFFPNLSKDGKWLFFTAAPLKNSKGEIIGAIETLRDVTERKQAQQELQKSHDELELRVKERTAQLEASMYELEAFAYSVSHDLQAPLRAISGFSEILLKDYLDTLDDKGQHYLQRVRAGTVNMSQMIEHLLTLSRIGRRPIHKKRVDIEGLTKETYELLSETERKNRKVDFTIKPCPPVLSDPQLLKIVLTNLLSNALKFTRKCKKAEIEFGCKTEDKKNTFYLKDNGIGFDMKYADKLFAPFQRLHKEEEYEGSGIGLATVQRIIHRQGGEIRVESIPGSGTTFYFTL